MPVSASRVPADPVSDFPTEIEPTAVVLQHVDDAQALLVVTEPARHEVVQHVQSLTRLGRVEWARVISRLRRARLLSQPDPKKPDNLDTHPLVREYFGVGASS